MPLSALTADRTSGRHYNLLHQELRETIERARVGGFFYPLAVVLASIVTTRSVTWAAAGIVLVFSALAWLRTTVRAVEALPLAGVRRRLVLLWTIILVTSLIWSAFSAWCFLTLPEPAPLIAVLFSGAFGMAMCHTLCMRRVPSAIAITAFMLPCAILLWSREGAGVALMWLVYTGYMVIVLVREHRGYRSRLELEEDLREQRDVFERQSRVDGLTGIANRREFDDALERAIGRSRNGTAEASLLVLDLDHFKHVNDSHGHLVGDACLIAVARRLQVRFSTPGDTATRLGGEEFAVVLEASGIDAHARAEQFRCDLDATPVEVEGLRVPMTTSIGCGTFDAARHADADAFYRDVDAALYRAKLAGRNRVERAVAPLADTDESRRPLDRPSSPFPRRPGGHASGAP